LEFVPHKGYVGGISRGQTEEYPLVGACERSRMNQLRFHVVAFNHTRTFPRSAESTRSAVEAVSIAVVKEGNRHAEHCYRTCGHDQGVGAPIIAHGANDQDVRTGCKTIEHKHRSGV
jgi:hypothetical protein